MRIKKERERERVGRLSHICLGLNYIVYRVQSCFLLSKKKNPSYPAAFYLKFLTTIKGVFSLATPCYFKNLS